VPSNTLLNLSGKKIMLAPLDWGLGHAARCIPLIKQLQRQNNILIIACTASQKKFLEEELNEVEFVSLFGYNMSYARFFPLWIKIMFQLPKLISVVRREHKWLVTYLKNNKVDVLINDNRFGLYHQDIESIFITHQLNIQVPVCGKIINRVNTFFINKYTHCWVPDYKDEEKRLSGILSHGNNQLKTIQFIGPLSRFEKKETKQKKYDVLLLLSGPEPQRALLEEKLITAFSGTTYAIALVRGTLQTREKKLPPNFFVKDMASSKELQELFTSSGKIICRSGYSTLMDLHILELKALLIPTSGQTEQEYLAGYWKEKFGFSFLEQKNISKESVESFMKLQ
jgi:uncharacterized protein (TIGR00661 family)